MKNYKEIWDSLSTTFADASFFVGYLSDEEDIRSNGQFTANFLREVLQIQPTDKVLEIGCGVARIGRELAPFCGEWHGSDISGNMIDYARQRTKDVPNIYLHELPESDLGIFNGGYFDCVYSSIVFMHLDKIEMFNYIREAYRVLAPGGRVYFDTYNLLAPEAWQEFIKIMHSYAPGHRPGYVSQFSTPQEMRKFMQEAGFADVHVDDVNPQLVVALGSKPKDGAYQRPASALNPEAIAEAAPQETVEEGILKIMDGKAILPFEEWVQISGHVVAKDSYINELELAVAEKNRHIAALEARMRKQEARMRPLLVRVALRMSKLRRMPDKTGV